MTRRHLPAAAAAAVALILGSAATPAGATAIAPSGQARLSPAPASLAPGAFEDDGFVRVMDAVATTSTRSVPAAMLLSSSAATVLGGAYVLRRRRRLAA